MRMDDVSRKPLHFEKEFLKKEYYYVLPDIYIQIVGKGCILFWRKAWSVNDESMKSVFSNNRGRSGPPFQH